MLNQRIGFGIEERGRFGIARLNPHIFVNSAQLKHFGGNNIKGNINGRSAQNPAFLAGRVLKNLFLIFGKLFLVFNTRRSFHMQPVRTINQMRSDNLNRTYDLGAFFGSLLLRNLNNQALAFAQRNFVKAGFFRVQKSFAAAVNVNEKADFVVSQIKLARNSAQIDIAFGGLIFLNKLKLLRFSGTKHGNPGQSIFLFINDYVCFHFTPIPFSKFLVS